MELRHLRYFTVLAGTLNFTRAAERLHVTQSTLSHQIRQLEDEIGQPLFERVGRRVSLTEAGDEFLHHAAQALRAIDLGLGALRQDAVQSTGLLRIGSNGSFADDLYLALVTTAFAGGQAAMVLLAAAALRMRPGAIRPAALVWLPVYWWLHSLALVLAVIDLVRRPHFWAKTEHGVSQRPAGRRVAPAATGGHDVADDVAAAGGMAQSIAGSVRR